MAMLQEEISSPTSWAAAVHFACVSILVMMRVRMPLAVSCLAAKVLAAARL